MLISKRSYQNIPEGIIDKILFQFTLGGNPKRLQTKSIPALLDPNNKIMSRPNIKSDNFEKIQPQNSQLLKNTCKQP